MSVETEGRSDDRRALGIALLATAVAAALRLHNLALESIWLDEAVSLQQASRGLIEMARATAGDNYPPLHNFFLFASIRLFGDGEFGARLPSMIFGVLTIPVIFAIGRELFGGMGGAIAALLVAVAPFQIAYSQEARMYSLFALCAALSLYFFLLHLRRPSPVVAAAYVVATAAMLYSHFYALFTITAENLFFLWLLFRRREAAGRQLVPWIGMQAVIVVLFLPWLRFFLRRFAGVQHGFWISEPTVGNTLSYFTRFAGNEVPLHAGLVVIAVVVLAMLRPAMAPQPPLGAGMRGFVLTWREKNLLLGLWLLLPLVAAHLLSLVLQPFLEPRYLIAASLAWYLLVAAGIATMARDKPVVGGVLGLLVVGIGALTLRTYYLEPHKHDWRGALAYVRQRLAPGDIILINPKNEEIVLRYYARGAPLTILPYPGAESDLATGIGRRWVMSEVAQDECWSGEPGPVGRARPLIERRIFFQAAVCLHGAPLPSR